MNLPILLLVGFLSLTLGGCVHMVSVTTVEEIKTSQYRAEFSSPDSPSEVNLCMKEALYNYRSDKGRSSYEGITSRDFAKMHEIILRTDVIVAMVGAEIMFLIQNSQRDAGGTSTAVWVHQRLIGSQGYLNTLTGVLRPCLKGSAAVLPMNAQGAARTAGSKGESRGSPIGDDAATKLEKLKGLSDRGVITREEFEQKKKELLDSM